MEETRGLWCYPCALMKCSDYGGGKATGGSQEMGVLVNKPLMHFKKLFGKDGYINKHKATRFHITNLERMEEFLKRTENV